MGYTTEFKGYFKIEPPLEKAQVKYLRKLAGTRRMQRDEVEVAKLPDPLREAVGLPVGYQGEYYVGAKGFAGQDNDPSIKDFNQPAGSVPWTGDQSWEAREKIHQDNMKEGRGQPSLWLQWLVNQNGDRLRWDKGEKFYRYGQWLSYLIERFFKPWGRTLNGVVTYQGEDFDDRGRIVVENNAVRFEKSSDGGWKTVDPPIRA